MSQSPSHHGDTAATNPSDPTTTAATSTTPKTSGVEPVSLRSSNTNMNVSSSTVVNKSHHGIKRIMSEVRELQKNPSSDYEAHPLEDNLFEWHFTIAGPKDSAFEGGIYHGRIILPPEYPHKPPDIVLLTPSGRFETNTKICLSLTSYHPESWTPQWGIRTVLIALQGFFPTEAKGIGSIDYPDSVRRKLAIQSRKWKCDVCGTCNDEVLQTTPEEVINNNSSETTADEKVKCCEQHHSECPHVKSHTSSIIETTQNTAKPATTTKPSLQNGGLKEPPKPKKSSVWLLDLLIALVVMIISYIVYIKFSSGRK